MPLLLHFLKLDIESRSLDLEDWLRRLYVSNDLTARFPEREVSLRLQIENKADAAARAIIQPRQAIFAETNLCAAPAFYADGCFYSANHGDFWHELEYDLTARTIRVNVGGAFLTSGQHVIANLLRPLLQSFILAFYRLKTLHGALLSKGSRTLLLSGAGGAGKTTTAVQLMLAGYDLLSDDGPLFTTEGHRSYACSSLDYIHLTAHTLHLFPELRSAVIGRQDAREKYAVTVLDRAGGAWTEARPITHYLRLSRRHIGTPCISRLQPAVVHRELMNNAMTIFRHAHFRNSPYPFRDYSEFIFELITNVVREAEVYEVAFDDHHLPQVPALLDHL